MLPCTQFLPAGLVLRYPRGFRLVWPKHVPARIQPFKLTFTFHKSHLEIGIIRAEHKLRVRHVLSNLLVMLQRSGEQDAEGEEREGPALDRPAGQAVAAPLHHLSEVVGGTHVFKQASWKGAQSGGALRDTRTAKG